MWVAATLASAVLILCSSVPFCFTSLRGWALPRMRWHTSFCWGRGTESACYEKCCCKWIFPSSLWWSLSWAQNPQLLQWLCPPFPTAAVTWSNFWPGQEFFPEVAFATITTLDMGVLQWGDSLGHFSSFRKSKRNTFNVKAWCTATWIKHNFFKIAVYTQWSCLPLASLFSGLAVAPTRKHFGGGIPMSGSISPTKIKALCERAGDSCCLQHPHIVWGCYPGKKMGGKKGVSWSYLFTQARFVGDLAEE